MRSVTCPGEMKTKIIASAFLLLAVLNACGQADVATVKSQAQAQVDTLTAKLLRHEVGKVEILQIPPDVLTYVAVTPETLEKQFHYKLVIRNITSGAYRDEFIKAMKSITVQEESEMPDLRWGIIFYDRNDNRLGAIYFDKWGKRGAVWNIPVFIKGDLFRWLNKNFGKCFR